MVVNELRLTGVTAFATADLVAIAKFTPGAEVSLADLESMALRITEHYRQHGYFVARAYLPAQDITLRVVTIAVREGNYGQVDLRNSSRLDDGAANRLLKGLDGGKIITLAPLENRLLLLSDLPGVDVTSTLAPGTEPVRRTWRPLISPRGERSPAAWMPTTPATRTRASIASGPR